MITPETSSEAIPILKDLEKRGYVVSVFHNKGSLYKTVEPFTEIHAIDLSADPPGQYIARAYLNEHQNADHAAAIQLVELIDQ